MKPRTTIIPHGKRRVELVIVDRHGDHWRHGMTIREARLLAHQLQVAIRAAAKKGKGAKA